MTRKAPSNNLENFYTRLDHNGNRRLVDYDGDVVDTGSADTRGKRKVRQEERERRKQRRHSNKEWRGVMLLLDVERGRSAARFVVWDVKNNRRGIMFLTDAVLAMENCGWQSPDTLPKGIRVPKVKKWERGEDGEFSHVKHDATIRGWTRGRFKVVKRGKNYGFQFRGKDE